MPSLGHLVPREHGFWTILAAVLTAALVRAPFTPAVVATALLVLGASALLGGLINRHIRRSSVAQLASAGALSVAAAPVELVGGLPLGAVVSAAAAWAAIFVSSALIVRAAFARARRDRRLSRLLDGSSIGLCAVACTTFVALGAWREALATGMGAVACTGLVIAHPTVKQMKPVGLALAGLAALAALALAA